MRQQGQSLGIALGPLGVTGEQMAFNLRNRHFLRLLDFTPNEIEFTPSKLSW